MCNCYYKDFKEAIFHLENGKTIRSTLIGKEVKKVRGDYYYRINSSSRITQWTLCKLDEGLFTSGEVQCSWEVIDLE